MKPLTSTFLAATTAGILWLGTTHAFAQDDAPPPPPPGEAAAGGPGGPGGGGDREDRMKKFQQQMNERIKTQLKASDDEWAVIQPLLEKVQTKLREGMESRFGGMRGMGGGPGGQRRGGENRGGGNGGGNTADANRPDANRQRPPGRGPTPEAQELMTTLQNDNASTNDIKTKLQALRDQRKKSEAELAQSREDLKKVLTLRQEAILVSAGMLD